MPTVALPNLHTDRAFRDAARGLLAAQVHPDAVLWQFDGGLDDLFADPPRPVKDATVTVPRTFVDLMQKVVWHSDPQRFARLYHLLWRLRGAPGLMADRGDPELAKLRVMEKAVRRDKHKMTAFVRFREIEGGTRRRFAAWFEPTHFITEPSAPFFANRFGDMDWIIQTPHLTAHFENGTVRFSDGMEKPPLPEDATENLWRTYYANIFNPARLKVKAMQAEMPKKYWKNLPEASLIPDMIAQAERRAKAMQDAAPTLPPIRSDRILARLPEPPTPDALNACTRCALHCTATQAVPGVGPGGGVMVVGEQPGDQEDLAGRPFVGPAGQLFDQIAQEAGLNRDQLYLTNAVKHFKFTPRGKQRIHQRPDRSEIEACQWWLNSEIDQIQPQLIVAMGATATQALTGDGKAIGKRRGQIEITAEGRRVLITYHPSYLLRVPNEEARQRDTAFFRADLALAAAVQTAVRA